VREREREREIERKKIPKFIKSHNRHIAEEHKNSYNHEIDQYHKNTKKLIQ
jgi:hypothetical protein